jgi:hypothetical protein
LLKTPEVHTTAAAVVAAVPLLQELAKRRVNCSHCVEKEELVQLLAVTLMKEEQDTAVKAARGEADLGDYDDGVPWTTVPCDLTPWMPMALFLQAEGNEWAVGRPKEVQDMFRKAVAAAKGSRSSSSNDGGGGSVPGDELYGMFIGWNLVHVLVDGGQMFTVKEVVDVMAWIQLWKKQLKRWKGYEMISPRIQVLKQPCLDKFKVRTNGLWFFSGEKRGNECALVMDVHVCNSVG